MPEDGASLKEFVAAWTSLAAGGVKGKAIDVAKARSAVAKAERDEMETAALKGELLKRGDVTSAVQGAFARVRARLLALPSKAAPITSPMKSVVTIQEKLTELVHEALAELSTTQIGVEEASADRGDRDAPGGEPGDRDGRVDVVAGADTAAAADGQPVGGPAPVSKPGRKRRAR
ncbi:MAG: hypothetical protein ACTHM0_13395 [Sphingomonas sp.]